MTKRSLPDNRGIARKGPVKEPKLLLIIACEGKNTEPKYIKDFSTDRGNSLIRLCPAAGVPLSVVNSAIDERTKQLKIAKQSGDSFEYRFEVWAVFDVDEHPNLQEAKDLARSHNVKAAISNPCFELWPMYHIADHHAPDDRHELQRKLQKLMPSYRSDKSKDLDYSELAEKYDVARSRAINGIKCRAEEGDERGRPSTNIFELLDAIIVNGKL